MDRAFGVGVRGLNGTWMGNCGHYSSIQTGSLSTFSVDMDVSNGGARWRHISTCSLSAPLWGATGDFWVTLGGLRSGLSHFLVTIRAHTWAATPPWPFHLFYFDAICIRVGKICRSEWPTLCYVSESHSWTCSRQFHYLEQGL